MKFEIYEDKVGEYRWRVTARNGEIIGASSEGFKHKIDCSTNASLLLDALNSEFDIPF